MSASRRQGAALIMALLAIIVLDCIVLGTLHIALQEHRIGTNRSAVLQLRLDAESGARRALGFWTAEIDSMAPGGGFRVEFPRAGTAPAHVEIERVNDHLFLLESIAAEPLPRVGRAVARLLIQPPAMPPDRDPAPAPISSTGPVHITATGVTVSRPPAGCAAAAPTYSVLAPVSGVTIDPGAVLDAPAGPIGPRPLIGTFDRLASLAPHVLTEGDTTISADAAGVLLVRGGVTLDGDAEFRGLLVAGGSVRIEPAAAVYGAVHAAAGVTLAGRVQADRCVVEAAIRSAALDRPRPSGPRPWLPAF